MISGTCLSSSVSLDCPHWQMASSSPQGTVQKPGFVLVSPPADLHGWSLQPGPRRPASSHARLFSVPRPPAWPKPPSPTWVLHRPHSWAFLFRSVPATQMSPRVPFSHPTPCFEESSHPQHPRERAQPPTSRPPCLLRAEPSVMTSLIYLVPWLMSAPVSPTGMYFGGPG